MHEYTLLRLIEAAIASNRQNARHLIIDLSVMQDFPSALTGAACVEFSHIVQEAIVNTRRHAAATRITVALGVSGDDVWAEVRDDGRGFPLGSTREGMGMVGMRERARLLNGSLEIESGHGTGTLIRVRVAASTFIPFVTDLPLSAPADAVAAAS